MGMDANDLPTDVRELKELVLRTRTSFETIRREAAAARRECEVAQRERELALQQVAELATTIGEQQAQLEQKERLIAELLKALRGKQRERIDPTQLMLFEIGELEQLIEEKKAESEEAAAPRSRRPHGRRLIPDGLPEEVIEYELPESERCCPVDDQVMPRIRWEESKQLDYTPAKLKVIVHGRAVYACGEKHDEANLATAPKPPQPIDKGLASAGLLAQMVIGKFGDHLPGYRLEDIFSRHGVEIRRSTIYGWLSGMADLCEPLYERMRERVLESKVIHTDDRQVKLMDPSLPGTRRARFWCYLGDDRHRVAVYDFTEDRVRAGPAEFLKGFRGYLQADAYGGYDGIYMKSGARSWKSPAGPTVGATGIRRGSTIRRGRTTYWR